MCVSVCHRMTKSTHKIDPRLLFVILLLVDVDKALPIDLELGALRDLAHGITKLLLANTLLG